MSRVNADSMTNAQGEFMPGKPRDQPLQTSGHQPGQMVGNDAAPEFTAQVLPAGSAPPDRTFKPNPVNEVPGQADNATAVERTEALDMPGATSADVHTGYGHPGSGQTSTETRGDGKKERLGLVGQAEGGSGMQGDLSAEAANLQKDHTTGPANVKEHNVSLEGAESKEPVSAEQVASMGDKARKQDYDHTAERPPGAHS